MNCSACFSPNASCVLTVRTASILDQTTQSALQYSRALTQQAAAIAAMRKQNQQLRLDMGLPTL